MEDLKKLELLNNELELENAALKEKIKQYKDIIDKNKNDAENAIKDIEKKYKEENNNLIIQKDSLQEKLDSILYSRSYRLIQKIKNFVKRG